MTIHCDRCGCVSSTVRRDPRDNVARCDVCYSNEYHHLADNFPARYVFHPDRGESYYFEADNKQVAQSVAAERFHGVCGALYRLP